MEIKSKNNVLTFAHDLWYAYDNPAKSKPTLPRSELNGITGKNPLLFDPASGDYTIHSDSPAFMAGKSVPGGTIGLRNGRILRLIWCQDRSRDVISPIRPWEGPRKSRFWKSK